MIIVPNLVAASYMRTNSTGRNKPCTLMCTSDNGVTGEYIVKPFGKIQSFIVCEFAAAVLGRELGLNIPEPGTVYVDIRILEMTPGFPGELVPYWKNGPHFGSKNLGTGYSVLNSGYQFSNEALQQAVEIFAFDLLIQNADRKAEGCPGNPNILFKGNNLHPIDHDMAFSFVGLIGASDSPWQLRNDPLVTEHLLYMPLRKFSARVPEFLDTFLEKLAGLPVDYMESVMQTLPPQWYNDKYSQKICKHFETVLCNIERYRKGILEAIV